VRELVDARQDAEIAAWKAQVADFQYILVIDRQQLEEYCSEPDYYQMILTPDELDEQVENWISLFSASSYRVALSPEPIDIPFTLQGQSVDLRGDRRNRSEPRPGRLSGLRLADERIAEEFRREAWSLMQMTEVAFKDKDFIAPWIGALARGYRLDYRRHGR
jgi:hypothetical protein